MNDACVGLRAKADIPVRALQGRAARMLPAVVLTCLGAPLQGLHLCSGGRPSWDCVRASQLSPLKALCQQLRVLDVRDLDEMGSSLRSTVRHLSSLTELRLATQHAYDCCDTRAYSGILEAAAALPLLEVLAVTDHGRVTLPELPHAMSRLVRLRQLQIRGIGTARASEALATLTALQNLVLLQGLQRVQWTPSPSPGSSGSDHSDHSPAASDSESDSDTETGSDSDSDSDPDSDSDSASESESGSSSGFSDASQPHTPPPPPPSSHAAAAADALPLIKVLPAGITALRGLRELQVTCSGHRLQPLALPELELLHLEAPVLYIQVT